MNADIDLKEDMFSPAIRGEKTQIRYVVLVLSIGLMYGVD